MGFHPSDGRRSSERILVFGDSGTGKSKAWLDLAATVHKTDGEGTFYCIDTDFGVERMLDEGYNYLVDEGRLQYWQAADFDEMKNAGEEIAKLAGKNDWIILDMLDSPWIEVRNWFIQNVYGQDPEEYFVDTRRKIKEALDAGAKGHERQYGGSSGLDWDYITKIYLAWEQKLTVRTRANVYAATSIAAVDERSASAEEIKMYAITGGIKPYGQKRVRHRFHSVIYMKRTLSGWEMTCVKDRGREETWKELGGKGKTLPVRRFEMDYLKKIGGWTTKSDV